MSEEFVDDLEATVRRHAGEIDADDLRDAAGRLDRLADKWEAIDR